MLQLAGFDHGPQGVVETYYKAEPEKYLTNTKVFVIVAAIAIVAVAVIVIANYYLEDARVEIVVALEVAADTVGNSVG